LAPHILQPPALFVFSLCLFVSRRERDHAKLNGDWVACPDIPLHHASSAARHDAVHDCEDRREDYNVGRAARSNDAAFTA
jgi:hypothetical protein